MNIHVIQFNYSASITKIFPELTLKQIINITNIPLIDSKYFNNLTFILNFKFKFDLHLK